MGKLLLLSLLGCTSPSTECSALTACNSGGYKFCKQGAACFYALTDGSTIYCTDCGDCGAAVQRVTAWCGSQPGGPDMALQPSTGLTIPKSGPPYTGTMSDPGLNTLSDCADASLEPNDNPATALSFTPVPDMPTAKIIKLAICPKGPNPRTGSHDQDWFKVDLVGSSSLTLKAEVFYDVTFGDLDVAIVDGGGNILASDGTAVTNACAVAQVSSAVYYVVVAGANNVDVNNYQLLIRTFSSVTTCP
jgi:hypothetical protein